MTLFGARHATTTSATPLTRLESSADWTTKALAIAGCDLVEPWKSMVRTNLWEDGTPTSVYGDRCYTDTEVANMGQVMVKIPKFWYYIDDTGLPNRDYYISNSASDTVGGNAVQVHPMFITNGVTKDYIYVSAFEGYVNGTKLESRAGAAPDIVKEKTLTNYRTWANNRYTGNKWGNWTFQAWSGMQLLYLVEYADLDSQGANGLGGGITAVGASIANTGTTGLGSSHDVGNMSYGTAANATSPVSYRGVENIFGNTMTYVDGINMKQTGAHPWIADYGYDCANVSAAPYVDTGIVCQWSEADTKYFMTHINYGGKVAYPGTAPLFGNDWYFLPDPAASTGNNLTYFCDSGSIIAAGGTNTVAVGGLAGSATQAGIFYVGARYSCATPAYDGWNGRLMWTP